MLQHCQNLTVCLCLFGCQGSCQHWLFLPEVKLLINETSSRGPGRGITPVISSPSPPPPGSVSRWQSLQHSASLCWSNILYHWSHLSLSDDCLDVPVVTFTGSQRDQVRDIGSPGDSSLETRATLSMSSWQILLLSNFSPATGANPSNQEKYWFLVHIYSQQKKWIWNDSNTCWN